MKTWYIYGHWTKDTNELFYIGVGKDNRAWDRGSSGRNQYWKNIVNKRDYSVEIICDGFTCRDEAVKEEVRLQLLNEPRACLKYGDSYNSVISKETGKKISKALKGKKLTKEHRKKLSEAKKGKYVGDKNAFYGKKHSQEVINILKKPKPKDQIERMRKTRIKQSGKAVINCRGEEYQTMREAATAFNLKITRSISYSVKTGASAGKYCDGSRVYWKLL